jgi:hypothetical protein
MIRRRAVTNALSASLTIAELIVGGPSIFQMVSPAVFVSAMSAPPYSKSHETKGSRREKLGRT